MKMNLKKRMINFDYFKLTIITIIFATFFWLNLFAKRLLPKIGEMAIVEAENNTYTNLYEIVNDCIKKVDKEKFLVFKKNHNNELVLTEYNMDKIYELVNLINEKSKNQNRDIVFFIPGGMASKKFLLNYWGSKIPIKTRMMNNMYANAKTKVTNYGINNALVEVYIIVEVRQQLLIPFEKRIIKKDYELLVSSYFINGQVPGIYGKSFEFSSNIFDIQKKI